MRKVLAALLALLMLAGFTGCGSQREPARAALCMAGDSGIAAESAAELEAALTAAGFQVQVLDAGNDQRRQLEQLQELVEDQYDVLVIQPVMAGASLEIAQVLQSVKTGAIFIHREPEPEVLQSSEKLCFVGPDAAQWGKLQPQLLQQLPELGDVNGDGQISYVFLGGPEEDLDTQLRLAGCRELSAIEEKTLSCLEVCYGQWDRQSGMEMMTQQLAKYGKDIEVVFCADDDIATGALEAVEDGGRTAGQDIYLLGIDGQQHAQVLIRSGELSGTVALDLAFMAGTVTDLAQKLLAGKAVEDRYTVPCLLLTQENIDAHMDSHNG